MMESLRQALHEETAGVPALGDIDRAIHQVSTSRRRWAAVIGVAASVLVLLVALVGPGWQPLAVEPAGPQPVAPQPGPTATSSVTPDPALPEPATAVQLPMVDPVPVTPRQAGDLTYVADGSIVRRAPDGTATTWVARSALDDACGRPDCTILDLEWSPNGGQLSVVLGTIRRTSPSQLGVYVISDDHSAPPRKLLECLPAMCDTLQGLAISWSPDSAALVVAGERLGEGLVVVEANGPAAEPRNLCDDCPAAAPAWSPDGRWIAYLSGGTVRRISAEGGPSELVAKGPVQSIAWSPDGTRLLIGAADGVHVLDLSRLPFSTTTIENVSPGEGPSAPAWSPDGKRISWFSTPPLDEGFTAEVWTASSDGSDPQRLMRSGCCVSDWSAPAWSPDGDVIALGLGLDPARPPDLILLQSGDGTEFERVAGLGWGPMSWQALP